MNNSSIHTKSLLRLFSHNPCIFNHKTKILPSLFQRTYDKHLSSSQSRPKDPVRPKDVEIPVPWGIVSAQQWGDPSKKPIVCIHGWKDNSATFDHLLPLLIPHLPNYQFLAIDLPGHGFSSHFPPGMIYQMTDCLVLINRILRHFNWSKINILGHSYGAQVGFMYSGTQPKVVENLITIDALTPFVMAKEEMLGMIPKLINDTLNFEHKLVTKSPPLYPYEEALRRVMKGHMGGLDELSCKILMSRGIIENIPGSGLFRFTHDIRVQYLPVTSISSRQISYIAKNFRCNVLHIKAKDGVRYERPYIVSNIEEWLNYSKEHPHLVKFVTVDGFHHVHLTDPETVLSHIVEFLKNQ